MSRWSRLSQKRRGIIAVTRVGGTARGGSLSNPGDDQGQGNRGGTGGDDDKGGSGGGEG